MRRRARVESGRRATINSAKQRRRRMVLFHTHTSHTPTYVRSFDSRGLTSRKTAKEPSGNVMSPCYGTAFKIPKLRQSKK